MIPHFAPPSIDGFELETLDQIVVDDQNSRVTLKLSLEHKHISQRLFFALMDDGRESGIAISVHPATGEVCDLVNGGGVIGYLASSPLAIHQPVECEIVLFKFGPNCVCNARVHGETFLYPAFTAVPGSLRLTALVGVEADNVRGGIDHSNVSLTSTGTDSPQAVA